MKKRAFVRYSKNGKIVPGSLILTGGSYPQGPSTWKEVPADLCCESNYGNWKLVTGGQAGDGQVLIDGTDEFTFVGPNDDENDGWVYLTRYFSEKTCLEIDYEYATFDGGAYDCPVYWTSSNEPTGEPGDTTCRTSGDSDNGTWQVSIPAGQWFSIGIYSDDSCCGRGFLQVSIDEIECIFPYSADYDENAGVICSAPSSSYTVYSADIPLAIGSLVFTNNDLTGPVPDGYILVEGVIYRIISGAIFANMGTC